MLQIAEDLQPQTIVCNGDFVEWRHLSLKYQTRDVDGFGRDVAEETTLAREMLEQLSKRVKGTTRKVFLEGNHEFRLFRAISQIPQVLKLLGIKSIARALCVDDVLGITRNGWEYGGEYPAGIWLFNQGPNANDVFVHHSYTTRKKAGYQGHSEIDTRLCSTVTGHGERLAAVWRRGMGRQLFACEGGNLSILGIPKKGQGIRGSVPFNQPEFLDTKQGFVIIHRVGFHNFPFCVPIEDGQAIWNGRLYKA